MPKKGAGQGKGGGPKTKEGKINSSGNATKHGLRGSKTVVLSDEEPADYEAVKQGWREEFQPEGYAETRLVDELISADWALLRAKRRVAWAEDAAVADWTEESKHHLELMHRYQTAAQRTFYRAWNAVQALRKDRLRMRDREHQIHEKIAGVETRLEKVEKRQESNGAKKTPFGQVRGGAGRGRPARSGGPHHKAS